VTSTPGRNSAPRRRKLTGMVAFYVTIAGLVVMLISLLCSLASHLWRASGNVAVRARRSDLHRLHTRSVGGGGHLFRMRCFPAHPTVAVRPALRTRHRLAARISTLGLVPHLIWIGS
jgi:hypothetical protein